MTYSVLCAVKWRGDGTLGEEFRPDLNFAEVPGVIGWEDVTGQVPTKRPTDTPIYVVKVTVEDLAGVAALNALPGVLVLYKRNDKDDEDGGNDGDKTLTANQVTAARNRLIAIGVPPAAAATIVGSVGEYTRDEVARRLVVAARRADPG